MIEREDHHRETLTVIESTREETLEAQGDIIEGILERGDLQDTPKRGGNTETRPKEEEAGVSLPEGGTIEESKIASARRSKRSILTSRRRTQTERGTMELTGMDSSG